MSKHLRRAVQAASRDRTPPISPSTTPPPPPIEPPPPPTTEPDNETREEKVKRLLNIARRPSLSSSLKLSGLERGSSASDVSVGVEQGDSLKRSSSYREQKSPRMISDEPELAAKRTASSGALPSPRRLSVDLTGLLTDRRNNKESPPASPRREKRKSVSLPPTVLTGTYSRILYYASPMGAFMTPPTVFMVPNDTMSDEVRMALAKAHYAEFGAGDDGDEAALKVDAVYMCDCKSKLYTRFIRKKWPAEHFFLQSCIVTGAPDPQLSGDGCKRIVTHEYVFKHPV